MSDLNAELQESGWEELRKEARKIERDLDVKLSSYAKLASRSSQGGSFFFPPLGDPRVPHLRLLVALRISPSPFLPTSQVVFLKLKVTTNIIKSFAVVVVGEFAQANSGSSTILQLNCFPESQSRGMPLRPRSASRCFVDSGSPSSSRSWKSMEMEIQSLLEKLVDINDSMSRCAASAVPTASVTQKLARHRDILHELTQEFRRIKGNINSMKEHAELLSSVRDDISEYKASGSMSPKVQLLRERGAIHGSISHCVAVVALSRVAAVASSGFVCDVDLVIDEVISQAQATRSVLGSQRAFFGDVGGKMKRLSEKFPVIRGLLGSIRRKRSRDTLILSAVIAACTLFLIIYWLSK
ncbi:hypothetical protein KSS87_021597 [Heliosperma pusillum]|nr:hypothetical protein KSS87_021597 [Heliosperma pusillum]